ncbi:cysteine desulfurase family protein [Naumannella halotolerans]|uniref:Cysteine desulfurase n=1 Tax=Naumannella halotolerans TaxID=993414 RepID=A0A4R7JAL3_9ACTN|nr:cysteine desulfurase family protein [Naumannella halotolerans]TDT33603.1 cysteine desulfurase [Naumannella halotolerans]
MVNETGVRSYLDHAASSPMRPEAIEAMARELGQPGNPSSTHAAGRRARKALEEARESIAADLGAQPSEVIFTSGGTEADNLAVKGSWLARRTGPAARNGIVTSTVEHPAVSKAAAAAVAEGAELVEVGVDARGRVDLGEVADVLSERIAVLSIQWANGETGVGQPVPELAALAAGHDIWFHTDAVQALSSLPVDFAAAGADLMSVTAHKIGGPVGVGALIARKTVSPAALGFGGAQERDLRSGTVPVALALGFAAALRATVSGRQLAARGYEQHRRRIVDLVRRIDGARLNGVAEGPASTINLSFSGLRSDDLLLLLDAEGIDVSAGSACSAGVARPSAVLVAMGLSEQLASGALRISFGHSTTDADVDRLLAVLPDAVRRARAAY